MLFTKNIIPDIHDFLVLNLFVLYEIDKDTYMATRNNKKVTRNIVHYKNVYHPLHQMT